MAHAQGRHQPAALRAPQWRQVPLNGISVATGCMPASK
jgi:hypothetical protein